MKDGKVSEASEVFARRCDPEYLERYKDFIVYLEQVGFEYIGHGTTRFVFKRGNYYVKVAFIDAGDLSNYREAKYWHRDRFRKEIKVAPCRLLPNGALLMVKVEIVDYVYELCPWAAYVDCGQVGLYKGQFVAYDL